MRRRAGRPEPPGPAWSSGRGGGRRRSRLRPIKGFSLLLRLVPAAIVAGSVPAWSAPWYDQDFATNLAACTGSASAPDWCAEWIRAVEAARTGTTDWDLPEWHRLTLAYAAGQCAALLAPAWCEPWRAGMVAAMATPTYRATADRARAKVAAAEAAAKADADKRARRLQRLRTRKFTAEDLASIEQEADAGGVEALEILGWLYAAGHGVEVDYAKAYGYYGRAVLAGRKDLIKNLDALWPHLNERQKRDMLGRFRAEPAQE